MAELSARLLVGGPPGDATHAASVDAAKLALRAMLPKSVHRALQWLSWAASDKRGGTLMLLAVLAFKVANAASWTVYQPGSDVAGQGGWGTWASANWWAWVELNVANVLAFLVRGPLDTRVRFGPDDVSARDVPQAVAERAHVPRALRRYMWYAVIMMGLFTAETIVLAGLSSVHGGDAAPLALAISTWTAAACFGLALYWAFLVDVIATALYLDSTVQVLVERWERVLQVPPAPVLAAAMLAAPTESGHVPPRKAPAPAPAPAVGAGAVLGGGADAHAATSGVRAGLPLGSMLAQLDAVALLYHEMSEAAMPAVLLLAASLVASTVVFVSTNLLRASVLGTGTMIAFVAEGVFMFGGLLLLLMPVAFCNTSHKRLLGLVGTATPVVMGASVGGGGGAGGAGAAITYSDAAAAAALRHTELLALSRHLETHARKLTLRRWGVKVTYDTTRRVLQSLAVSALALVVKEGITSHLK